MKKTHRTLKNIILSLVIIVMIASAGVTAYFAKDAFAGRIGQPAASQMIGGAPGGNSQNGSQVTPPEKPNGNDQNGTQNTPPERPNGNDQNGTQNTPPEKPDGNDQNGTQNTPPERPDGNDQNGTQNTPSERPDGNDQNGTQNTPPERPDGNDQNGTQNTPSERPDGNKKGGTDTQRTDNGGTTVQDAVTVTQTAVQTEQTDVVSSATPLAKKDTQNAPSETPDGNDQNGTQNTPPERPDSDMRGDMPALPGDMQGGAGRPSRLPFYILFGAEGLIAGMALIYLLMSRFNKKTLKETFVNYDKVIIFLLAVTLFAGMFSFAGAGVAGYIASDGTHLTRQSLQNAQNAEATGTFKVTDQQTLSGTYSSAQSDENALLVTDGGAALIKNSTIEKSAGDTTNNESSDFYGINAALLVQKGSSATVKNSTITSSVRGGNAVFATGEGAKAILKNVKIKTTGASGSRGLDATYGGVIEAKQVTVSTDGASSAALATDRGEGKVTVSDSTLETNGAGSPVIYSTGDISITDTTGTANGSQMAVIEGKNSATVTTSTLTASGAGNRKDVDQAGVMIYQSMSGDAGEGTGTFTAVNSSLSLQSASSYYKTAPMFFITNTNAVIRLENTKLDFGSGVLLRAAATDEWGKSGENGGTVTMEAQKQTLVGNIEADALSEVTLKLTASTFEGAINTENTAKSVTLTLDKDSRIKLTGDTWLTALQDADGTFANIDFNGFHLYVGGKEVK